MIQKVLNFLKTLHTFQDIKRLIYKTGTDERENDAEHSYQLAMLAWYLIDAEKLDLDKGLVLKYALVHDFVEVYAGDTPFFRSEEESEKKRVRERESQKRLQKEFPEFSELHEYIERYEMQADKESGFVYALDKVLPVLNVYIDEGRIWRDFQITHELLLSSKDPKIQSPEIKEFWNNLKEILEENKHMFHEKHEKGGK